LGFQNCKPSRIEIGHEAIVRLKQRSDNTFSKIISRNFPAMTKENQNNLTEDSRWPLRPSNQVPSE
jgi:hypothetical protein